MTSIGVVSDIHGNRMMLDRARAALSGVCALVFLGDGLRDARRLGEALGVPLFAVAGNCDLSGAPREIVTEFEGVKTLITHGHAYGVKSSLTALSLRAREAGAALALYGHTHRPDVAQDRGVLLLNPGALTDGRLAIVEFRENGPVPTMKIL